MPWHVRHKVCQPGRACLSKAKQVVGSYSIAQCIELCVCDVTLQAIHVPEAHP